MSGDIQSGKTLDGDRSSPQDTRNAQKINHSNGAPGGMRLTRRQVGEGAL
ncbi:hypothetical protein FIU83_15200 [Halomonas sp. THAF5a]|nr:hypothetical protein FIU83_15200 [Halomonas sp. THAF5a]